MCRGALLANWPQLDAAPALHAACFPSCKPLQAPCSHLPLRSHAARRLLQSLAETASLAGRSEEETSALLAACRERLYDARQKRPHPHRDDKVRGRCCCWQQCCCCAGL